MKHILITTIAAVLLAGCGESQELSIHQAATTGNIKAVKQHLDAGADVNAKDDKGRTPLDHLQGGDRDRLADLFPHNRRKRTETAALLRKHGGMTVEELNAGMTPLHAAAGKGLKEIVELLIAEGADVNAKDDKGRTPLDLATRLTSWTHIRRKRTETAALLRKHGGKTGEWLKAGESIHIAARVGHIEAVKHHLAAGTDVNAKDEDGKTPLDHAEAEWEGDVVEVNAARNEVADLLRKHGGKTTRPNISIHDAAGARGRRGNIEAVKQHLAAGTDVDARDKEDKTPLKHAAYRGYKEIVELLIAKGADVNAKDEDGRTALDWAHGETAELLRNHGGKRGEEMKAEGK